MARSTSVPSVGRRTGPRTAFRTMFPLNTRTGRAGTGTSSSSAIETPKSNKSILSFLFLPFQSKVPLHWCRNTLRTPPKAASAHSVEGCSQTPALRSTFKMCTFTTAAPTGAPGANNRTEQKTASKRTSTQNIETGRVLL